jgi:very-long-chain ceramide synthase
MLKYLSFSTLCDVSSLIFMLSWAVTRHVIFGLVIKSAIYDSKAILPYGWDPVRGYYFTRGVYIACVSMLIALQVRLRWCYGEVVPYPYYDLQLLQIMWFWIICRVAIKVVTGQGAEDTRSDDEM